MSESDQSHNQARSEPAPRRASPFKTLLLFVVALMTLYYVLGNVSHDTVPSSVHWRTEFDQAAGEARTTGKLIFADFYATWCGPCRQMDHDVFSDSRFADALESVAIPLRVDITQQQGRRLAARHAVDAVPTFIVLTPDGTQLARDDGFRTAEELLTMLRQAGAGSHTQPHE